MRSKYEIKAQKELEAEDYKVDFKIRPGRFFRGSVDFFGLFDLVAVRPGGCVRWISIKGHAGIPGQHLKEVQEFWFPEGNLKEIWYWPNNKRKREWVKKIVA